MRWNLILATLIVAASTTGGAQTSLGVPTNSAGEELFGGDYLPAAPGEESAPLEPGRPHAGFRSGTASTLSEIRESIELSRARRTRAPPATAPLLRSVRKANNLPRMRATAPPVDALAHPDADAELKVHFVNVGQGAGAILEFPCHTAIIDSGGEYASGLNTVDGGKLFADYLAQYFADRPERGNIIDVVITSHPHEDHLAGLKHIMAATGAGAYKVRNVVDNGQTHSKGSLAAQQSFRRWVRQSNPTAGYSFVNFKAAITATGVTNKVIDPIGNCKGIDPVITAFWGAYNEKIKPEAADWLNPNNHSLVVRVDFGAASFLFVGDLEDVGAKEMLREYEDNLGAFDVDVYHVSHHGAGNDTFDRMIGAMSPDHAIISMGTPAAQVRSTAWAYGHPRQKAIDALQKQPEIVGRTRNAKTFHIAPAIKSFDSSSVTRAIFGTGWEGTIIVRAKANGDLSIASGQN